MKKILAIALSVLMIISVLPFAAFADSVPVADVAKIADADLKGLAADVGNIDLDVGYVFTAREAEAGNMYNEWIADYVISVDKDVAAGAVTLAGQYNQNADTWVTLTSPDVFPAGYGMKLLQSGALGGQYTFTYQNICDLVKVFKCGAVMNDDSAAGTKMTVELRLFNPADQSESILINKFEYSFGAVESNDVVPQASAIVLNKDELSVPTANGTLDLDVGYKFVAAETKDTIDAFAANNKYANCPADFVIKTDEPIPAGAVTFAGFYAHNDANWVTLNSDGQTTELRLLDSGVLGDSYTFTYVDIVDYVGTFYCGAKMNDPAAIGTKVTVELRLFPEGEDSILVDSFTYVFSAAENGQSMTAESVIDYNAYLDVDTYAQESGIEADQFYLMVTYNTNSNVSEQKAFTTVRKELDDEDVTKITSGDYAGTYEFKVPVAPSQIDEPIKIELFIEGENDPVYTAETSVYNLCLAYIADSASSDKLVTFCKSLIDYARAAQISFGYDNVIGNGYYDARVTTLTNLDQRPTTGLNLGGLNVTAYSFTCKADSEANVYFSDSDISVLASNGGEAEIRNNSQLKVKGIAPAEVNNLFEVQLSNGGTVKLALSNILNFYVTRGAVVADQNLARALYLYGIAADELF